MELSGKIVSSLLKDGDLILEVELTSGPNGTGVIDGHLKCKKSFEDCQAEEFHVGRDLKVEIEAI
ncbi:MAG: hypothetical protein JSW25_07825 [Thermoplasmata archaeon]|nr:MAG: hypothetical protein JSW25_07825 [Thermoplasmata archaeon]